MAEPQNGSPHTNWSIWVGKGIEDGMELRETLTDVPVGRVFETAMKFCRDEGWDRVDIMRVHTSG